MNINSYKMKKLVFIPLLFLVLVSCTGGNKKKIKEEQKSTTGPGSQTDLAKQHLKDKVKSISESIYAVVEGSDKSGDSVSMDQGLLKKAKKKIIVSRLLLIK